MTSNEEHAKFLAQLEPIVSELSRTIVRIEGSTVVQVSIAISLKRIADHLGNIVLNGIITGTPED